MAFNTSFEKTGMNRHRSRLVTVRQRCATILRENIVASDVVLAAHAAEGLTEKGHAQEVRRVLLPRFYNESNEKSRCLLARELFRAGDQERLSIITQILERDVETHHVVAPTKASAPQRRITMSIIADRSRLAKAAAALIEIDQAGQLRELGDTIMAARRDHKRHAMDRGIGHEIYVGQLATVLSRTTGLPYRTCHAAVTEAVSPEWPTVALDAIIAYAAEQSAEVWA